jgi:hypothetical protein
MMGFTPLNASYKLRRPRAERALKKVVAKIPTAKATRPPDFPE